MSYFVDFTLPDNELLLALINHDNGIKLIPSQVVFGAPIQYGISPLSTVVNVTVNDRYTGDYKYDIDVNYVRATPHKLFSYTGLILPSNININSINEVLIYINAKYGVNFTARMCTVTEESSSTFTLSITDGNLIYTGEITGELLDYDAHSGTRRVITIPNVVRTSSDIRTDGDCNIAINTCDLSASAGINSTVVIAPKLSRKPMYINTVAVAGSDVFNLIVQVAASVTGRVQLHEHSRTMSSIDCFNVCTGGIDDISNTVTGTTSTIILAQANRSRFLEILAVSGFGYVTIK